MNLSPDDPRMSDYALGEMDAGKMKEFEAAMAENPDVFDEVHEIRDTVSLVSDAVENAPKLRLTATQRHRILRLATAPAPAEVITPQFTHARPAFWNWFGKFTAGAAAAGIVAAALIYSYHSGYKDGVVDKVSAQPPQNPEAADKAQGGGNETPAITITLLDEEGEARPVGRPVGPELLLPVGKGQEDAFVASMPTVHPGNSEEADPENPEAKPETDILPQGPEGEPLVAGTNPDQGVDQPKGRLPISTGSSRVMETCQVLENPFVEVNSSPRSSFPLRAMANSYVACSSDIVLNGQFPDPSKVAIEEFVNAFMYSVPGHVNRSSYTHPLAAGVEVFSCPWNDAHRLVRVTVRATDRIRSADPKVVAEEVEFLIEFNRKRAAEYRLIGFDGAGLLSAVNGASEKARTLFSGDTVTALYEVVPAEDAPSLDRFRYAPHNFAFPPRSKGDELLYLSVSYKHPENPDGVGQQNGNRDLLKAYISDCESHWKRSSSDFQLAAAAAAFGMKLSGSDHLGEFGFRDIEKLAARSVAEKTDPRRAEFLKIVQEAVKLSGER